MYDETKQSYNLYRGKRYVVTVRADSWGQAVTIGVREFNIPGRSCQAKLVEEN